MKKVLIAGAIVVAGAAGVFAGSKIERRADQPVYVLSGGVCVPITTTPHTLFSENSGPGIQTAAIRTDGGTLRQLWRNSSCNQTVYFKPL